MTSPPHDDDLQTETELPGVSDLQLVDLDSQLNRRRSPRQKLISVSVSTLLVLLATLVGLQYSHVLPTGLLGATPAPTATPPRHSFPFGKRFTPQQIAISTNVASSAITLNGAHVPPPAYGPYAIITLKNGRNTLAIDAPPLAPRACVISYPYDSIADTCQRLSGVDGAPLIDLTLGWESLPPQQQQQFISVISAYIGELDDPMWHTTIPTGQYYLAGYDTATGLPRAKVATTTLSAALSANIASPNEPFTNCQYVICPTQYFALRNDAALPTALRWTIQAHTTLAWNFAPATGAAPTTVPATPPAMANAPTNNILLTALQSLRLVLTYDPATGWSIVKEDTLGMNAVFQTVCAVGNQFVATAAAAQGIDPIEVASTMQPSIAGCRMYYTLTTNGSNDYSPQFVYRFGVLLAGNDDAHHLFPQLPLASATVNAAVPGQ